MSKTRSTTITLPLERASQLRAIAAAHGLSLTNLSTDILKAKFVRAQFRMKSRVFE